MKFKTLFSSIIDDRLYILLIPAFIILMTDMPVFLSLSYTMSIVVAIVATAHWLRQVLFPYLNMGELIASAKQSPIASAIVVAAMMLMMALMILVTVFWVRN